MGSLLSAEKGIGIKNATGYWKFLFNHTVKQRNKIKKFQYLKLSSPHRITAFGMVGMDDLDLDNGRIDGRHLALKMQLFGGCQFADTDPFEVFAEFATVDSTE